MLNFLHKQEHRTQLEVYLILEQMKKKNDIFFNGLSLAYNKLLTFGVKQLPFSETDGKGLDWIEFSQLCEKLIKRELTGYAARDEIIKIKNKSLKDEWNFFYRRILQKDMRCGLSERTVNNVAKKNQYQEYIIPVFSCQLAQDCELHKKNLCSHQGGLEQVQGHAHILKMENGRINILHAISFQPPA